MECEEKNMNKKVLWITQTGVLVALLIIAQAVTSSLGNTIVTGSIVNLILIVAVMLCGVYTGASVALISPIFAKFFGIGPLWSLIPFIALGNVVIVIVWYLIGNKNAKKPMVMYVIACVVGAVCKALTLYITIAQFAVPILLQLEEPQASVISATFSLPQFITATIGGVLAIAVLPVLKKATKAQSE